MLIFCKARVGAPVTPRPCARPLWRRTACRRLSRGPAPQARLQCRATSVCARLTDSAPVSSPARPSQGIGAKRVKTGVSTHIPRAFVGMLNRRWAADRTSFDARWAPRHGDPVKARCAPLPPPLRHNFYCQGSGQRFAQGFLSYRFGRGGGCPSMMGAKSHADLHHGRRNPSLPRQQAADMIAPETFAKPRRSPRQGAPSRHDAFLNRRLKLAPLSAIRTNCRARARSASTAQSRSRSCCG